MDADAVLQGACVIVIGGIAIVGLGVGLFFHGTMFFVLVHSFLDEFRKKPSEAEGKTSSDEKPTSVAATVIVGLIIIALLITLCLWREIS